jgi:predicted XRE-type DNA-binding protein
VTIYPVGTILKNLTDVVIFDKITMPKETETIMNKKLKIEVVHGSGNVFRYTGYPNPDVEQAKAILSAEIIKSLDSQKLSVRKAQALTKVQAADFSRIRNADLGRFTIDRLIKILNKLDPDADINMEVRYSKKRKRAPSALNA